MSACVCTGAHCWPFKAHNSKIPMITAIAGTTVQRHTLPPGRTHGSVACRQLQEGLGWGATPVLGRSRHAMCPSRLRGQCGQPCSAKFVPGRTALSLLRRLLRVGPLLQAGGGVRHSRRALRGRERHMPEPDLQRSAKWRGVQHHGRPRAVMG